MQTGIKPSESQRRSKLLFFFTMVVSAIFTDLHVATTWRAAAPRVVVGTKSFASINATSCCMSSWSCLCKAAVWRAVPPSVAIRALTASGYLSSKTLDLPLIYVHSSMVQKHIGHFGVVIPRAYKIKSWRILSSWYLWGCLFPLILP